MAMCVFIGGVSALAAVVGYLVGASNSPVVAAALPLLFAILGGAGGLQVLRADLSSRQCRQQLQAFGLALLFFSLAFTGGLSFGVAVRSPSGFAALWPGTQEDVTAYAPAASTRIELVLMRAKLRVLGANEDEIERILRGHARGLESDEHREAYMRLVSRRVRESSAAVERIGAGVRELLRADGLSEDPPAYIHALDTLLNEALDTYLRALATDLSLGPTGFTPGETLLDDHLGTMRAILDDTDSVLFLRRMAVDTRDLFMLEANLVGLQVLLSSHGATSGVGADVDGFVSALLEQRATADAPTPAFRGLAEHRHGGR